MWSIASESKIHLIFCDKFLVERLMIRHWFVWSIIWLIPLLTLIGLVHLFSVGLLFKWFKWVRLEPKPVGPGLCYCMFNSETSISSILSSLIVSSWLEFDSLSSLIEAKPLFLVSRFLNIPSFSLSQLRSDHSF
jgi:hypothetical protein